MKITSVEAQVWKGRYNSEVRPAWAPGTAWSGRSSTVFLVHTDEGLTGIGAGVGDPRVVAERLAPRLVGQDPFLFERHTDMLRNNGGPWLGTPILWGVEMALWDLFGKACGQPLWKIWGGYTNRIKAYASMIEVRSPEQRAEDALRYLDLGYRAIKLRIHNWTLEEDIAQVEAVRKAVGDRMEIMVDANQAQTPGTPRNADGPVWTYERAAATCRELARLDVRWLEEPLPRFAFDDLARLTVESDVPIAGGENNVGLHEFRLLVDRGCYDIIQADAVCSEGMFQLRKVAAYAEMHNRLFVPHHGGNAVGIAAHLHLSGGCPNSPYVELLQDLPAVSAADFQSLIAPPYFEPDPDGFVHIPDGPGLGVEIGDTWERAQ
ncbi:MAG: mandelate racemase/muconate lactonizing enzyme family protein [Chloroflexi bacterium]|nr:mandelate racemase/muconate lactonizing enzyme family protein [Chloroflexota bacterium]